MSNHNTASEVGTVSGSGKIAALGSRPFATHTPTVNSSALHAAKVIEETLRRPVMIVQPGVSGSDIGVWDKGIGGGQWDILQLVLQDAIDNGQDWLLGTTQTELTVIDHGEAQSNLAPLYTYADGNLTSLITQVFAASDAAPTMRFVACEVASEAAGATVSRINREWRHVAAQKGRWPRFGLVPSGGLELSGADTVHLSGAALEQKGKWIADVALGLDPGVTSNAADIAARRQNSLLIDERLHVLLAEMSFAASDKKNQTITVTGRRTGVTTVFEVDGVRTRVTPVFPATSAVFVLKNTSPSTVRIWYPDRPNEDEPPGITINQVAGAGTLRSIWINPDARISQLFLGGHSNLTGRVDRTFLRRDLETLRLQGSPLLDFSDFVAAEMGAPLTLLNFSGCLLPIAVQSAITRENAARDGNITVQGLGDPAGHSVVGVFDQVPDLTMALTNGLQVNNGDVAFVTSGPDGLLNVLKVAEGEPGNPGIAPPGWVNLSLSGSTGGTRLLSYYLAQGDDENDDTIALNNWLLAPGAKWADPTKKYRFKSELNIPANTVIEGRLNIAWDGPGNSRMLVIGDNFKFDELCIDVPNVTGCRIETGVGFNGHLLKATCGSQSNQGFMSSTNVDFHLDVMISRNFTRPFTFYNDERKSGGYLGKLDVSPTLRGFKSVKADDWRIDLLRTRVKADAASKSPGHNGVLIESSSNWSIGDVDLDGIGEHGVRIAGDELSSNCRLGSYRFATLGGSVFKCNADVITRDVGIGTCIGTGNHDVATLGGNSEALRLSHVKGFTCDFFHLSPVAGSDASVRSCFDAFAFNDAEDVHIGHAFVSGVKNNIIDFDETRDVANGLGAGPCRNITFGYLGGSVKDATYGMQIKMPTQAFGGLIVSSGHLTGLAGDLINITASEGGLDSTCRINMTIEHTAPPKWTNVPDDGSFLMDISWAGYRTFGHARDNWSAAMQIFGEAGVSDDVQDNRATLLLDAKDTAVVEGAIGPMLAFARPASGRRGAGVASVQTGSSASNVGLGFFTGVSSISSDGMIMRAWLDHTGDFVLAAGGLIAEYTVNKSMSSDPADPDVGHSVTWTSDGSGSGNSGDVMVKINVGGTVKTATLVDYSAI